MAIETLPETPLACSEIEPDQPAGGVASPALSKAGELPGELSQFSQRLASFGLGEAPDPLLTEARSKAKRRSPA